MDFTRPFAELRALPCDIFLGAHGSYFGMLEKLPRASAARASVWTDPDGYRRALVEYRALFAAALLRQQQSVPTR